MLRTASRKEAVDFFKRHPRAIIVQRLRNGVSAGTFQPGVPNRVRHRGRTLRRAFTGPHTKREAKALADGIRRDVRVSGQKAFVTTRTTKRGTFLFVEVE